MNEMNEEELQQWLDAKKQLPAGNPLSDDAKVYRALFEALGEEPGGGLPYDFAAKTARHIQASEKRSNELKYNVAAALIFVVALAVVYGLLVFFIPDQAPVLLKYRWILLLFPIAFIVIQYFDQKLVKVKIFSSRS
jgi:hypothetical protein